MKYEYLRLAITNLLRRRRRSILTMIGIFIGIALVVSLISLGQGMQKAIEEKFFQLGADKVNIQTKGVVTGPPGSNSDVQLKKGDLEVIQHSRGVEIAAGRLVEGIKVEFNNKERYLYVASLPQEPKERAMVMQAANVKDTDIIAGRMLKPDDRWKVVVSEDYYKNLNFNNKALSPGDKILINNQSVEVVGIFKKTGNPFVDMSFAMNEQPIRDLLNIPDKYGIIVAKAASDQEVSNVALNIEKDLRKFRKVKEGKEDFEVKTSEQTMATFKTVLDIITSVLVGIAAISILVGGIGIMNTMYTSVLERKREIGVMKAIGAQNKDILMIFMLEAGTLGLVGGAIGIAIGMGFSKLVEVIATAALGTQLIQASFPWYLIVGSLVFSFVIGCLAGTFPAMQASKLQPVEALRQ